MPSSRNIRAQRRAKQEHRDVITYPPPEPLEAEAERIEKLFDRQEQESDDDDD